LVIGHEISGTVSAESADASGLAAGTPVVVNPLLPCGRCPSCRDGRPQNCVRLRLLGIDVAGGATSHVVVAAGSLVPAPAGTDLLHLAFAEPLAVAVRAVAKAGVGLGDRVLVVGAGPVGLAVARCAELAGAATVSVVERSASRRDVATALGLPALDAVPDDGSADVVFDAAAHPAVAAAVTGAAAPLARIVLVGVYGTPAPMDLQAATFKELTLMGTRVYSAAELRTAVDMIAGGRFDAAPLLTSTVSITDGPGAITALRAGEGIKTVVAGAPQ
jgi:2-desacetyl-2-hydroxyethyl bacteriochlorophyllide A dehydrogenase